jgi:hypothetical protein
MLIDLFAMQGLRPWKSAENAKTPAVSPSERMKCSKASVLVYPNTGSSLDFQRTAPKGFEASASPKYHCIVGMQHLPRLQG